MFLLLLLLICHFLGDFTPLSNSWMQRAKQFGKPFHPILAHAAVHGGLMFMVLLFFTTFQKAIVLGIFQLVIHFIIDTWKGRMNGWFPSLQNTSDSGYWMIFGFDQLLHQITIVMMIMYLN